MAVNGGAADGAAVGAAGVVRRAGHGVGGNGHDVAGADGVATGAHVGGATTAGRRRGTLLEGSASSFLCVSYLQHVGVYPCVVHVVLGLRCQRFGGLTYRLSLGGGGPMVYAVQRCMRCSSGWGCPMRLLRP